MKQSILDAVHSLNMTARVSDTGTTRVYLTYPLAFQQPLCVDVTGVPTEWVIKAVGAVMMSVLQTQDDSSEGEVYAHVIAALYSLASKAGVNPTVSVSATPYVNMENVSGIVCESITDAHLEDGQYNPTCSVYDGEVEGAVFNDYVGNLFI